MKAFLRQVAEHYYALGAAGLEGKCFIFPNRRSLVFWRKYLGEVISEDPLSRPIVSPQLMTINDFFYRLSGCTPTPRVRLLLELYRCYSGLLSENGGTAEPLDEFIFWGETILSDFGEIDKYRVDAEDLYQNIFDLKSIQDDFSDFSEEQIEAIRHFISHFNQVSGAPVGEDKDMKAGFLRTWKLMYPLYLRFGELLRSKGMSYEGMVYRDMADRLRSESVVDLLDGHFPAGTEYVFVGLNALNECEKFLMLRMKDAGVAQWCWDYVSDMVRHPQNASSFFMKRNVEAFPQAFELERVNGEEQEINVLSVPSAVGQAKQLPVIFGSLGPGVPGIETAVVLSDENLLVPVLNSIPEEIKDINVTMGYPMSGSAFHALMGDVESLQMHLRLKDGKWYFYHKQVWALLGSSIIKSLMSAEAAAKADDIRKAGQYYIPQDAFEGVELFECIFRPVVVDMASNSAESINALAEYLLDVIRFLGTRMTGSASLALELDYARGYYEAVTALSSEHLPVLPQTWIRLLGRMVSGTSVHFRGEPLKGLQIMGPLETRALDFENLVILSCNEGVFPRHSVAASYIPHELRKAFGLPTYEYQDAIWAYYFYRLIQRSRRVWLVYDSRMEGVRSGEESRYIKQLEMHFGVSLNRYVAKAPMTQASLDGDIPKTAGDVDKIRRTKLSASSLRNYLECPARFYFSKVQGLRSVDEVTEDLDDGMIGNVYHETMQELYTTGDGLVTRRYLESVSRDRVKELVRKHICAQLKTFEVTGRNLVFEHMICEYVQKTLQRDIELMRDRGVDAFRIIGLELERDFEFKGFKFTGKIDRMDSFIDGTLRVVDYKTGTVIRDDTEIDDYNAEDIVHKIFDPATKSSYRPKVAFQVYIYDVIASEMYPGASVVNSIYRPADLFRDKVAERPLNRKFYDCMTLALSSLLEEMVSLEIPFSRTSDTDRCKYCDFKMICGR